MIAGRQSADEDALLSRRVAGRIMAFVFGILAGVGNLAAIVLPGYPAASRSVVALLCATFIALGLLLWSLPWDRWPRRATLWIVPLAFIVVDVSNIVVPINPYRYGIYLTALFAWIGIAHRRGACLAFSPLLVVVYLLPLKVTGLLTPSAAMAAMYVALFCVLQGETLAWIAARLAETRWALRVSQDRYRALSENATDLVAVADCAGLYTYASPSFQTVLGYAPDDVVGSRVDDHFDAQSRALFAHHWAAWQQPGAGPTRLEIRVQHADGSWRSFEIMVQPVLHDPAIGGIMAIARDITERKQAEDELRRQALHDALTGLPNRTLLCERIKHAIAQSAHDHTPVALLLCDLDRFKEINDTFGHHHGDLVLQHIAERVRGVVRPTDTIARLGGDEFAVALCGDVAAARAAAQEIAASLEQPMIVEGQALHLAASMGIAVYPAHGADAATLLRRADVAMNAAKQEGHKVAVYAPERDPYSAERIALLAELRHAIAHGGLVLHYQPKIAFASGTVCGAEALARWPHPTRGFISPDQFVPLAEQTGQIGLLTHWALDEAVRQARRWQSQGLALPIAINLSAANLLDPQLYSLITDLLTAYDVPPSLLRLEVTESTLMADTGRVLGVLTSLSRLGIGLSIDDFGTGYSSLAYLKELPVDEIKIDRSFVQHVAEDESDAVIVASTIGLAHSLGRTVVAEGVETEHALNLLRDLKCDVAQGYYLSRPLPAEGFEHWMRGRTAMATGNPFAA